MIKKRKNGLLYDEKYGDIPDDLEGRLDILFNTKMVNKIRANVDASIKDIKKIKKVKMQFTWYTEPHPSHRPRANLRGGFVRMYVPMAAETKLDFREFMDENFPEFNMITTPMSFHIKSYLKTPEAFPRSHKILAELELIRPWGRVADCDNVIKTYTDCTIESLIRDDCMIHDMRSEKFYSIKPRVEFEVIFYSRWPKGFLPKEK